VHVIHPRADHNLIAVAAMALSVVIVLLTSRA
jgi:hypothetical protein